MRPRQRALALATVTLLLLACPALAGTARTGVVLEEVSPGAGLERAGLRPGDLVFAWERLPAPPHNPEGADGEIRTPFDWLRVRAEQAFRGPVRLHAERDGATLAFEVPKGPWEGKARPWMAEADLRAYQEGRKKIDAGDVDGGVALWDRLVQAGAPDLKRWLLLETGEAWSKAGQGNKARAAWQAALDPAADPQTRVPLEEALGKSFERNGEVEQAEALYRSALRTGEEAWGDSLMVSRTLTRLGNLLRVRNRLDESAQVQARALEIQQRWTPDSLDVADSLNQLEGVAWARGDLETMERYARQALAIQERWAPDGSSLARTLGALAIVAMEHGRLEEALEALERAYAIQERREPGGLAAAATLSNLGLVARTRGDLEAAEEKFEQALAIWEKLAPGGTGLAPILNNLAAIAKERGDLEAAKALFQRAVTIWGKAAPEGVGVAGGYDSLGMIAQLQGDLDEAWKLHSRSLEILERLSPGGKDVAGGLKNLGAIAEARGDLPAALDLCQRALAIHERLVPGTTTEAQTLHQLGRLHRRMGHADQAAHFLGRAVDALEAQVGRLGGSQSVQAEFRARFEEIYRDAVEVELERGHADRAFHLVERSRARTFLALLAERDLELAGELPAELERSRKENAARYDQAQRELARWTAKAGEEKRETLQRELSRLRRERDEIAVEIRKASPKLAALRQPQPLDLDAARGVLDPGTLALSYSVGKEKTALFALTREGGLRVETLPVGEKQLRQDVQRFLELVLQPAPGGAPEAAADLARSLYRTLIGPVADLVERGERVLILPDGPLHRLPFGALLRDPAGAERGRFLTEWKPLHTGLSLTVYATLRAAAGERSEPARLVAFGDPSYPRSLASGQARGPLALRSFDWSALPYSRREIERIAALYPGARLYLGAEATEERVKSVARDARLLHFATHGYIDDRTPLDSALVLTIPEGLPAGRDNGLLQVWEIFESVRLDADLVVLSACETALGRELSGEGMIGLTRAFQYAGARSVVASLWSVADQLTAELMTRFHRHYAAGLPKDEALRAAQMELIRGPVRVAGAAGRSLETNASAPFFWAAFQLFGDWR